MYTLRRISGPGVEMNFALGQSYTVVHRFISYEDFQRSFQAFYQKPHVADLDPTADWETLNVFAFVVSENGTSVHPLYKDQQSYIMTENGGTFSKLKP